MTSNTRRSVLFVAEAVTLAHVARPMALMAAVNTQDWDVCLACDQRARRFTDTACAQVLELPSIASSIFGDRLRHGSPVYTELELEQYVTADLDLIRRVRPDLIVGDFRLSLSISARLASVPYATIANTYWSPYAAERRLPIPVLPWTPYVPIGFAQRLFDIVSARILVRHCRPLNNVRAAYGLARLPLDLRVVYTDADYTLYADSPAVFPTAGAPAHHRYLGPIVWSPEVPDPSWWNELPSDRPLVYVTMGSSGSPHLLPVVCDGLTRIGCNVMASTAGHAVPSQQRPHTWLADYLPGERAAARSVLVVCNGGSPTSQQAVAAGVPVLGICANMDQFLNMRGLADSGLGAGLRADRASPETVARAADRLIRGNRAIDRKAFSAARQPDYASSFRRFLDDCFANEQALSLQGRGGHVPPAGVTK